MCFFPVAHVAICIQWNIPFQCAHCPNLHLSNFIFVHINWKSLGNFCCIYILIWSLNFKEISITEKLIVFWYPDYGLRQTQGALKMSYNQWECRLVFLSPLSVSGCPLQFDRWFALQKKYSIVNLFNLAPCNRKRSLCAVCPCPNTTSGIVWLKWIKLIHI